MENKIIDGIVKFYFIAVSVLMYYFLTEVIDVGLYITYRHAFALLLAGMGIICFLVKPDIGRGTVSAKSALVYSAPLFVTFLVSLFIWFVNTVDTDVISRGLSSTFIYMNMLSFALAAAAMLYIFGEKGIWYNLAAILCANLIMIGMIIAKNGIGAYFSELAELILTFADKTGSVIVQAEIHELAFCLGAYLIYMLLKPKKGILYLVLFVLLMFCFLSAFKRIAMIAVVVALAFGYLLKFVSKYSEKSAMRMTVFFTVLTILILIGYVGAIKMNVFEMLEKMGIDTSGRVKIYKSVSDCYEFSPSFLGNGIGFLTYRLNSKMHIGVAAVHNDFLQYFIDLGFWGYILWLISITLTRVLYFGRKGKIQSAVTAFSLTLYLVIVSSTDNTMSYPLLTAVLAILMIGDGYDKNVKETEVPFYENSYGK